MATADNVMMRWRRRRRRRRRRENVLTNIGSARRRNAAALPVCDVVGWSEANYWTMENRSVNSLVKAQKWLKIPKDQTEKA
jgi:hypothetical protein